MRLRRDPRDPRICKRDLGRGLDEFRAAGGEQLKLEAGEVLSPVRFEVLEPVTGEPKWMESYFARGPKGLPARFKVRS